MSNTRIGKLLQKFESNNLVISNEEVESLMKRFVSSPYSINSDNVTELKNSLGAYFEVQNSSKMSQKKSIDELVRKGVPKSKINIQDKKDSSNAYQFSYLVHPFI